MKPVRVAISGLGRIGRTILRQILAGEGFEVVLVNDIATVELCAYLVQFDSVFGPYRGEVRAEAGALVVDGKAIPFLRGPDIAGADLSAVDVFLDCTGKAQTAAFAGRALQAGARNVLISGPSPAAEVTVVMGANDGDLGDARIVSNASCTTNALAPVLRAVDSAWGVRQAHMTTIHCYTGSQPMIDAPRDDFARSRAGALSMVPTTTSAAHQVDLVLPALAGRISAASVRVPVASVSAIDVVIQLARAPDAPVTEALKALAEASPVIGWTEFANVSSDMRARADSVVLALPETQMVGDTQLRLFGWYDNEWGFSARMLDMARRMAERPD